MELIILLLVLLAVMAALVVNRFFHHGNPFPFYKRSQLFTQVERSFLQLLEKAVGEQYKIINRVKLADILELRDSTDTKTKRAALLKLNAKYLDFVLCNNEDMSIVAVIDLVNNTSKSGHKAVPDWFVSGALSIGATTADILTGAALALFALLFFLLDGRRIWLFVVGLFPRTAREAVDGAASAGWRTVTEFAKVQIFVAFVDGLGIGLIAFLLGVPLALPIGVAVFLASFVPFRGAVVTGALAVLIALVYNGPVIALLMLAGVLLVQQLEGNVLQPLVMGPAVRVHPLAVVLAVTAGGLLAGIPGTLFAVPIVAFLNVFVRYIASGAWRSTPAPLALGAAAPPPVPPRSERSR